MNYKRFVIYMSGTAQNGCPWTCIAPEGDVLRNEFARAQVCDLSGSSIYSVALVEVADPILEQPRALKEISNE